MKKHDINYVKNYISDLGGKCISEEYKNSKDKIQLLCPNCNSTFLNSFTNIKTRKIVICKNCSFSKRGKKQSHSYEYVKEEIEKSGCFLISQSYDNVDEKLKIKCSCGVNFETTFYKFQKRDKRQCNECGTKIISEKKKASFNSIKEYVEQFNYKLIETNKEKEKDQRVLLQCNKNHDPYWVNFTKFKTQGRRCPQCKYSRGEKYIEDVLNKKEVTFKREFTFDDLKGIGGNHLRYDFCIFKNDSIFALIEYDGRQHFEVSFNDEKAFKRTKEHDKIKDNYAKTNRIPLYRIAYFDFEKIPDILNDILL